MLSLFIAGRYLARAAQTKATASSLIISTFVLCIGSLALALALSITQAFEHKVFDRLQGINANAMVYSYGHKIDPITISSFIRNTHSSDVTGITPQSMHSIIVANNDKQAVISLRGINPATEGTVTSLAERIVVPKNAVRPPLTELFDKNKVLIGHVLAERLALEVGDELTIFVPDTSTTSKRIKLSQHSVTISGIFNIGLEEFDGATAFCSLEHFNAMLKIETGVDTLLLSIPRTPISMPGSWTAQIMSHIANNAPWKEDFQDNVVAQLKKELPHLTVTSWKDLYPAILSAMKLEKYAIIGIILLLTLVALMNVISTLFTLVNRKQRDIALFQAIGMPEETIRNIFIFMGMEIIGFSSIMGSLIAFCISFVLETWKCIPLPDAYYVEYLPASLNPVIFCMVPLVTMLLGFSVIVASVRHVQRIDALDVLRHTA